MKFYTKQLSLTSNGARVTYQNIMDDVKKAVSSSGVENGLCLVQSPHTTCSVIFEEFVHDLDYNGDEFLQADMNSILDKIVPREYTDNMDYRYPGPKHAEFLKSLENKPDYEGDLSTILNGDAHIRASLFGSSETFTVHNKAIQVGEMGSIYFVDFDQNRKRVRHCNITIIGE